MSPSERLPHGKVILMKKNYFRNSAELLDEISLLPDETPLAWINNAVSDSLTAGIWAIQKKYAEKDSYFSDSFDHELYRQTIYVSPKSPESFLEAPVCVQLGGEEPIPEAVVLEKAGDLKKFLQKTKGTEPLICVSNNYEHEGFVTQGVHLCFHEKEKKADPSFLFRRQMAQLRRIVKC